MNANRSFWQNELLDSTVTFTSGYPGIDH